MKRFFEHINQISWKTSLVYYIVLTLVISAIFMGYSNIYGVENADNIDFSMGISTGADSFPSEIIFNTDKSIHWSAFIFLTLIIIAVMIVKLFVESIVVVKMMRPPVNLLTSDFFVLNKSWGREGEEFYTLRILNATPFTLLQVNIKAVLVVEESNESPQDDMRWYFDIEGNKTEIDPMEISIFTPYTPWTYAIKSSLKVSSSAKNYTLESIEKVDGLKSVKRSIDLIITGSEANNGSEFVVHKSMELDSWSDTSGYKKHFQEGRFKSLPLEVKENFEDINVTVNS